MTPWWQLVLYILLAWSLLWQALKDFGRRRYAIAAIELLSASAWVVNFWRAP